MRISIVAIGKFKQDPLKKLFEEYRKRLTFPFDLIEVPAYPNLAKAQRQQRETDALIKAIPKDSDLVLLDERGDNMTTREFLDFFLELETKGTRYVSFVIGGADGLDPDFSKKGHTKIAFGRFTWPHLLTRLLLIEQIYRVQQLKAGHPYHRD